jgi:PAS domain S-box-containing protein
LTESDVEVRAAPRDVGKYLAQITLICAAYLVAGQLAEDLPIIISRGVGPVWPPSGIALGALLMFGYRVWPGVTAGAFLVALLSPDPPSIVAALVYAIGTTVASVIGTFLLRRVGNFDPSMSRLRDALGLVAFGAFGSSLVSASIGVSVPYVGQVRRWSGFGRSWLIYWLGDSIGVLLVTPLVLLLPSLRWKDLRSRLSEIIAFLLLLSVLCMIVFGDLPLVPVKLHVLTFAVLPFVMWAAIRFGVTGAAVSTFLIATIATVETAFGFGPFAQNTPFINAVLLDFFFAVLSVSGLTLAAAIAERDHAEKERGQLASRQAAMQERLRLAAIVESSDDAIIGKDMNGIITDWNHAAERLYGYPANEVIGRSISLLAPPDRADEFPEFMKKIRGGEIIRHFETTRRQKDGRCIEVAMTISPLIDTQGRIVGASTIARDISERKRQEAILRESEERFRLMADSAPALIWMSGNDKLCTYFNKTWLEFTGRSMEAEVGNGWAEGVHPEDLQKCLDTYTQSFNRREKYRMEYRLRQHDGEYRWILGIGVPRFNWDHAFVGYIGISVDVTESKRAEEALWQSREQLLAIWNNSPAGLFIKDRQGRYIDFNPLFAKLTSLPREQILGKTDEEIFPPKQAAAHRANDRQVLEENRSIECEETAEGADGSHTSIIQKFPLRDAQGHTYAICGLVTDVTERRRAEAALRESEERLRMAVRAGKMFAYEWDATTDEIVRSEGVNQILGDDEETHTTGQRLLAMIPPQDREKLNAAVAQLSPQDPYLRISYRMVRSDGKEIWVDRASRAYFDAQGGIVRIVGMVADITDRVRAEEDLAVMSRKLMEAEEQERARIARELHDHIGQRLALLSVEVQQVKEIVPDASVELRNRIDELEKWTLDITTDVQAVAHQLHSSKLEYLGLAAAARSFCAELAQKQKVDINFTHGGIPLTVPPEVSLCLFRVMQEALHNAVKHSGVRQFEVELYGSDTEIQLRVRDAGAGFDPELVTTTEGLGLISIQERVRMLKGAVSIISRPQSGAEVSVRVPLSAETTGERAKSAGA